MMGTAFLPLPSTDIDYPAPRPGALALAQNCTYLLSVPRATCQEN